VVLKNSLYAFYRTQEAWTVNLVSHELLLMHYMTFVITNQSNQVVSSRCFKRISIWGL